MLLFSLSPLPRPSFRTFYFFSIASTCRIFWLKRRDTSHGRLRQAVVSKPRGSRLLTSALMPLPHPHPPLNLEAEFQAKMEPPRLRKAISLFISRETALAGPGNAILFRLRRGPNWPGSRQALPRTPAGRHLSAFGGLLAGTRVQSLQQARLAVGENRGGGGVIEPNLDLGTSTFVIFK